MPSWGIHLKMAKEINKVLKLNDDLFTFGNLIPDVDDNSIYTRSDAHYYTGIKFMPCPQESEIDINMFLKDYNGKLNNPLLLGYYCHLLTDEFYNEYIYLNKWIQNKFKNIIAIKCNDESTIDVSKNFRDSLKYKHDDLEKYGRNIYHEENLYLPRNIEIIKENAKLLKDNFYSEENIINRIKYLNEGEFSKFNEISNDDIHNKDNYLLFNREELDKLFNDCYNYILEKIKDLNILKVLKAGCILINQETKSIAIVYREQYHDYSFPKGHLEKNETLIECAIRETAEETKRVAILLEDDPIYIEEYVTPNNEDVIVNYYLAKDMGHSDNDSLDTHETFFVPLDEVYDKLSYPSLKKTWSSIKGKVRKYIK